MPKSKNLCKIGAARKQKPDQPTLFSSQKNRSHGMASWFIHAFSLMRKPSAVWSRQTSKLREGPRRLTPRLNLAGFSVYYLDHNPGIIQVTCMPGQFLKYSCDLLRGLHKPDFLDSCGHSRAGIVANNVADTSGSAKHANKLLSLMQLAVYAKINKTPYTYSSQCIPMSIFFACSTDFWESLSGNHHSALSPSYLDSLPGGRRKDLHCSHPSAAACTPTSSLWSLKLCLQDTLVIY